MIRLKIKTFRGSEIDFSDDSESTYNILSKGTGYDKPDKTEMFLKSVTVFCDNLIRIESALN